MKWLKKLFAPKIKYIYLETEIPRPGVITPDQTDSIRALAHNPGFRALMNRLRLQRLQMQNRLQTDLNAPLDALRSLQLGVYWAGWLDHQVNFYVNANSQRVSEPSTDELAMFQEIYKTLEIIGEEQD